LLMAQSNPLLFVICLTLNIGYTAWNHSDFDAKFLQSPSLYLLGSSTDAVSNATTAFYSVQIALAAITYAVGFNRGSIDAYNLALLFLVSLSVSIRYDDSFSVTDGAFAFGMVAQIFTLLTAANVYVTSVKIQNERASSASAVEGRRGNLLSNASLVKVAYVFPVILIGMSLAAIGVAWDVESDGPVWVRSMWYTMIVGVVGIVAGLLGVSAVYYRFEQNRFWVFASAVLYIFVMVLVPTRVVVLARSSAFLDEACDCEALSGSVEQIYGHSCDFLKDSSTAWVVLMYFVWLFALVSGWAQYTLSEQLQSGTEDSKVGTSTAAWSRGDHSAGTYGARLLQIFELGISFTLASAFAYAVLTAVWETGPDYADVFATSEVLFACLASFMFLAYILQIMTARGFVNKSGWSDAFSGMSIVFTLWLSSTNFNLFINSLYNAVYGVTGAGTPLGDTNNCGFADCSAVPLTPTCGNSFTGTLDTTSADVLQNAAIMGTIFTGFATVISGLMALALLGLVEASQDSDLIEDAQDDVDDAGAPAIVATNV